MSERKMFMSYISDKEALLKTKIIAQTKKADFEEFWTKSVEQLRAVPLEIKMEKLVTPYDKSFTTYLVYFNTHDRTVSCAYFSHPNNATGKLPCVVEYHGGSMKGKIYPNIVATGVCCLSMHVRGQGGTVVDGADYQTTDFNGGLVTRGLLNKEDFYLRNVYLDAVRAVDVAADGVFMRGKKRFLNEANVLSRLLDLPSVVNIRDFFEENGTAYIVMDYIDGCNLREFSLMNGALSFNDVYGLLSPLLRDLKRMHDMGIIHRDISPSNILFTKSGEVKLIDFGAAVANGVSVTEDDSIMLKPCYAPPEQYRALELQGPWTDVYAFCATIYFCLTGQVPPDAPELLMGEQLPKLTALNCGVTAEMENVLKKGMASRAEDRIQDMGSLCGLLFPDNGAAQKKGRQDREEEQRAEKERMEKERAERERAERERIEK